MGNGQFGLYVVDYPGGQGLASSRARRSGNHFISERQCGATRPVSRYLGDLTSSNSLAGARSSFGGCGCDLGYRQFTGGSSYYDDYIYKHTGFYSNRLSAKSGRGGGYRNGNLLEPIPASWRSLIATNQRIEPPQPPECCGKYVNENGTVGGNTSDEYKTAVESVCVGYGESNEWGGNGPGLGGNGLNRNGLGLNGNGPGLGESRFGTGGNGFGPGGNGRGNGPGLEGNRFSPEGNRFGTGGNGYGGNGNGFDGGGNGFDGGGNGFGVGGNGFGPEGNGFGGSENGSGGGNGFGPGGNGFGPGGNGFGPGGNGFGQGGNGFGQGGNGFDTGGNGFGGGGNGFSGGGNGFDGGGNGFGGNGNGFGGNGNGFDGGGNGFGGDGNRFGGDGNRFGGGGNGFGGDGNRFGGDGNGFGPEGNGFGGSENGSEGGNGFGPGGRGNGLGSPGSQGIGNGLEEGDANWNRYVPQYNWVGRKSGKRSYSPKSLGLPGLPTVLEEPGGDLEDYKRKQRVKAPTSPNKVSAEVLQERSYHRLNKFPNADKASQFPDGNFNRHKNPDKGGSFNSGNASQSPNGGNANYSPNVGNTNNSPNGGNANYSPNGGNANYSPNGGNTNYSPNGGNANNSPNGGNANNSPNGGNTNNSPGGNANNSPNGGNTNYSPNGDNTNNSPNGGTANNSPNGGNANNSPNGGNTNNSNSPNGSNVNNSQYPNGGNINEHPNQFKSPNGLQFFSDVPPSLEKYGNKTKPNDGRNTLPDAFTQTTPRNSKDIPQSAGFKNDQNNQNLPGGENSEPPPLTSPILNQNQQHSKPPQMTDSSTQYSPRNSLEKSPSTKAQNNGKTPSNKPKSPSDPNPQTKNPYDDDDFTDDPHLKTRPSRKQMEGKHFDEIPNTWTRTFKPWSTTTTSKPELQRSNSMPVTMPRSDLNEPPPLTPPIEPVQPQRRKSTSAVTANNGGGGGGKMTATKPRTASAPTTPAQTKPLPVGQRRATDPGPGQAEQGKKSNSKAPQQRKSGELNLPNLDLTPTVDLNKLADKKSKKIILHRRETK